MAAERPNLDALYAQSRLKQPDGRVPLDVLYKKSKVTPSIYRKGGIYEQFGPNPPVFNPMPGPFGGPIQTGADQPGAALPFVGQVAGGMAAGPVYGVAGAMAGEGLRQIGGRIFGVQDEGDPMRQMQAAGRAAAEGELFGMGMNAAGSGVGRIVDDLKPGATKSAIRSARNIIRPTGKLRKRGDRIAETALKEDVLSSNREKMKFRIGQKLESVDQEVDNLISGAKSGTITAEDALKRVDALSRAYRQRGDFKSMEIVQRTKDNLIKAYGLESPVYGERETSQFVMGPASKQVTPKIHETYGSDIKGPIKSLKGKARYESERKPTGRFGRSEAKREVFIGSQNKPNKYQGTTLGDAPIEGEIVLGSPDDIAVMNIPKGSRGQASNQKIVSVGPSKTYTLRPETKGVSKKEIFVAGKKARDIAIPEAQGIKRGQYSLIKGKKTAAWDSNVGPDLAARQEFAGGVRRSMGDKVPGLNEANRRFGNLIELQDAVSGRDAVASRNNFFDLGDVVLASQGGGGAVAVLARKLAQSGQGAAARQLYKFGTSGPSQIPQISKSLSPAVRALIAGLRRPAYN